MVDYNEFAESIKKKYPEYADRDNKQLAEAMVKKYPEYADRVTFDEVEPQQVSGEGEQPTYALQAQVNVPKDIAGGLVSGFTEIPRAAQKLTAPIVEPIANALSYPISQGIRAIKQQPLQSFGDYSSQMGQLQEQLRQPYQPQSTAGEVAQFVGSVIPTLAMPQIKALKGAGYLSNLGNQLLTGATQGAVLGGTQALNKDQNLAQGIAKGAGVGSLIGGTLGAVSPIARGASKAIGNLPKGIRETAGISQTSYERLKYSPRGAEISAKSEEIGSPEFINNVANNLKSGIDAFKQQEISAFAKARDTLLSQNKDASIDTTDVVNNALLKLKNKGFIIGDVSNIAGNKIQNRLELKALKDSIELPDVTKSDYVRGRYKNRFFTKNITDDMSRSFIDADNALLNVTKEIKNNPTSAVQNMQVLEEALSKQVDKLPLEAQESYYNKLYKDLDVAYRYSELSNSLLPQGGIKLTRIGQKADKANEMLSDILSYQGKIGVDEAQQLKTYILDDIINYKPQAGQQLNQATRDLQSVAKELRRGINEKLNTTLGSEYTAINKKLSNILDIVDNPEIKDITNAQNIDTIASKLKRTGTTRTETAKKLADLEKIMNENGIKLSDYTIIDDILDHQAANEINKRVQTGLAGGLGNIIRRSAVQPALEEVVLPLQGSLSKLNLPKVNTEFLGQPNIYNATLNR